MQHWGPRLFSWNDNEIPVQGALFPPQIKLKLDVIDIPIEDLRMLFSLLDADESGDINIEEFRKGCLQLQGNAKSREMIKLAVHVSTYNRNLDDMQDVMDGQNSMLRRIYNRLYDLERAYLRQQGNKNKKGSKTRHAEEIVKTKNPTSGPVSILGAVAAAGRHLARRKSIDQKELESQQKYQPSRRSVDGIKGFMRRNSSAKRTNRDGTPYMESYVNPAIRGERQ